MPSKSDALLRSTESWSALADHDPMWAILSVPGTEGGRWDPEAFFASGQSDLNMLKTALGRVGGPEHFRDAIDFGCGLGRVSRWLTEIADCVLGLDSAPAMIRGAERFHSDVPGLAFKLATDPALPLPDESADLIYSRLVLQHLAAEVALDFVRDFFRVLRPSGYAVFQVMTENLATNQQTSSSPIVTAAGTVSIDMHVVPAREVRAVVASSGGKVLEEWSDGNDCGGAFQSVVFTTSKPPRT